MLDAQQRGLSRKLRAAVFSVSRLSAVRFHCQTTPSPFRVAYNLTAAKAAFYHRQAYSRELVPPVTISNVSKARRPGRHQTRHHQSSRRRNRNSETESRASRGSAVRLDEGCSGARRTAL